MVNITPIKMVIWGMAHGIVLTTLHYLEHQPHTVDGNPAPTWMVETLQIMG